MIFALARKPEEDTAIDAYAASSPAEFFAVLSEVFFADPTLLLHEYPPVYRLFATFYRQDPARRAELLMEEHDGLFVEGNLSMPAAPRR